MKDTTKKDVIEIDLNSTKKSLSIATALVVFVGFVVSATGIVVKATITLEGINKIQIKSMETNRIEHENFNKRISKNEEWRIRCEGYDAAMSVVKRSRNAGN